MAIYPEPSPETTEYAHQKGADEKNQPLTDLSFLGINRPWPPPGEEARLNRYEHNRLLWKGMHERVFYNNFWLVVDKEKAQALELVFNWHKRLSTLWADLLLSEQPRFLDGTKEEGEDAEEDKNPAPDPETPAAEPDGADNARDKNDPLNPPAPRTLPKKPSKKAVERQKLVDKIVKRDDNGYVSTLYEIAIDVSRYGDGVAKIVLDAESGAEIFAQSPGYWFPVVRPDNLRKITHHVLAHRVKRGDFDYLYAEIHTKGKITRVAFLLEGNRIKSQTDVAPFTSHPPEELTGVEDFLVVPFHGLRTSDEIFGVDDYQDVDSIVQAIEVRAGQINRILSKHSDPSMYGPEDALEKDEATGEYTVKAGGRYYVVDSENGEEAPGYVVWEPQMEAQFQEIDELLKQLYIVSETSPAAFGQMDAGLVESGSALRRLMQAPLAKVARLGMRFDPSARRTLKIACDLEHLHNGEPEIQEINAQWQDGLPPDPREQAETEKYRKEAGNTSLTSSIQRLDGCTEEEAEQELRRIEEEGQRTRHAELQNMKAQGALEVQKIEAQAQANPPSPTSPGASGSTASTPSK